MQKIILAATAALIASSVAALAHATLEVKEAPVGAAYKAVIRIGHGCEGEATLKVRVRVPEGLINAKPMPKADWTLETVRGPYAKAYESYGSSVTEGVTEIVWTGSLPDDHYDEFVFRGTIAKSLTPGDVLTVPVVQECADKAERWIEIPAAGQSADDLDYPAPGIKLLPAGN
jgi:uncharacterized protein YcnI